MNYPDLGNSKIICFDIETYDPLLKEKGNGVYRKDGLILGCGISNGDYKAYYNFNHKGITEEERIKNISYIKTVLGTNIPKLATNILYDTDWLINGYSIPINGELHDIQIAEPLICEYRDSYSLDSLANVYLNKNKSIDLLTNWCKAKGLTGDARKHIYNIPLEIVNEYVEGDVELPIQIFLKQIKILEQEELLDIYNIERGLIPLLLQMRKAGVRVDVNKINENTRKIYNKSKAAQKELNDFMGFEFNVKSPKHKEQLLNKLNLPIEYNEPTELMIAKGQTRGNPSMDKAKLKSYNHPVIKKVLEVSECRTILSMFFEGSLTENRIGDRIHANFNPLKSDDYGTISGRFSSTNPNLQQIPGKEETMGDECREVFIPEEGYKWAKWDWSQIEYRLIAHYAQGTGSEEIRNSYNTDPTTDYHQYIMNLTGLERKEAKVMNFGLAYFMGVKALSTKNGWSMEYSQQLTDTYHKNVPFLKPTRAHVVNVAKQRGYLKTLLKRRARVSPKMMSEHREYSLFNRLIQGSAADLMKKAMYDAYNAGVFNTLIPHLTVHDELDCSAPKTKEGIEAAKELTYIMENCIKLRIPIKADFEIGNNWAQVTEENKNKFMEGVYD